MLEVLQACSRANRLGKDCNVDQPGVWDCLMCVLTFIRSSEPTLNGQTQLLRTLPSRLHAADLIPFQLGGLPFLGIVVGMVMGLVTLPQVGAWAARTRIALIEKRRKGDCVDASSPEVSVKVALLAWWV